MSSLGELAGELSAEARASSVRGLRAAKSMGCRGRI